jgi:hypothetical protein
MKPKIKRNILLLFISSLMLPTSYYAYASGASRSYAQLKTDPQNHRMDPTQKKLKKIIEERLKSGSEIRKTIRRAVQPPKDKDRESSLKITMPVYAAMVDIIQEGNLVEFEKTVKKLKSLGVNTLVIRMSQNYGDPYHRPSKNQASVGVYFKSHFAPLVDDLLTPIIKIARRYKMRIFARMSSRRCDWASEQNPQWQDTGYDPGTGKEELVPILGLNLFNHHVRYYLINLFRELAQNPIDGIVLSDDFALGSIEGYGPEILAEFSMVAEQEEITMDIKKWFANVMSAKDGVYYIENYPKSIIRFFEWRSKKMGELATEIVKNVRLIDSTLVVGFLLRFDFILPQPKEYVLASTSLDLGEMVKADFDFYFSSLDPQEFFKRYPRIETGYKGLANTSRYLKKRVQGKQLWILPTEGERQNIDRSRSKIFQALRAIDLEGKIAYHPYNEPFAPSIIEEFLPLKTAPK